MDNKEEETKITSSTSEEPKDNPVIPEEKPVIEEKKEVELPGLTQEPKEEPKEVPKEEAKEEPKEEPKEAPKEEPKEEPKETSIVPEIPSKEITKEEIPQGPVEIINQKFDTGAEKEDVKIEGNKLESANFTQMFNVASEENVKDEPLKNPKEEATSAPVQPTVAEAPVEQAAKIEQSATETASIQEQAPKENRGKKSSNFNAEERTLYTMEEEKESNPIMAGIFIAIFVVFIVLLPIITGTSERALEKIYGKERIHGEQKEDQPISKYYYFGDTTRLDVDDLTITNVVKATRGTKEYIMSLTLSNVSSRAYQFDKNYYIVMMSDDAIIYYIKLFSYDAVAPSGSTELTFVINEKAYKDTNRFRVDLIEEGEYPDANVSVEEGDYKVLTCKYLNDELKYYFTDNQLVKIRETYSETLSTENVQYEQHKKTYEALSAKYNAIDNFESIFVDRHAEDENVPKTFEMINTIDLANIPAKTLSNLRTYKFYSYNEKADVVSFETEALGYSCG